jgi:hypothetical protein
MFDEVFTSEGLRILKTPPRAPRANAFVEPWIGGLRRELLDRRRSRRAAEFLTLRRRERYLSGRTQPGVSRRIDKRKDP